MGVAAVGGEAPAQALLASAAGEVVAPQGNPHGEDVPSATGIVVALCVAATVVLGVWPAPLLDLARGATTIF